jgi:hypothetical protein
MAAPIRSGRLVAILDLACVIMANYRRLSLRRIADYRPALNLFQILGAVSVVHLVGCTIMKISVVMLTGTVHLPIPYEFG